MLSEIKSAVAARIAAWIAEGDAATVAELRREAFEHLRWQLERKPFSAAIAAMQAA